MANRAARRRRALQRKAQTAGAKPVTKLNPRRNQQKKKHTGAPGSSTGPPGPGVSQFALNRIAVVPKGVGNPLLQAVACILDPFNRDPVPVCSSGVKMGLFTLRARVAFSPVNGCPGAHYLGGPASLLAVTDTLAANARGTGTATAAAAAGILVTLFQSIYCIAGGLRVSLMQPTTASTGISAIGCTDNDTVATVNAATNAVNINQPFLKLCSLITGGIHPCERAIVPNSELAFTAPIANNAAAISGEWFVPMFASTAWPLAAANPPTVVVEAVSHYAATPLAAAYGVTQGTALGASPSAVLGLLRTITAKQDIASLGETPASRMGRVF